MNRQCITQVHPCTLHTRAPARTRTSHACAHTRARARPRPRRKKFPWQKFLTDFLFFSLVSVPSLFDSGLFSFQLFPIFCFNFFSFCGMSFQLARNSFWNWYHFLVSLFVAFYLVLFTIYFCFEIL